MATSVLNKFSAQCSVPLKLWPYDTL